MAKNPDFKTSWNRVVKSPGWALTVLKLFLVSFIPIFGSIVSWGYMSRWCRSLANGYNAPLPEKLFDNRDGQLYRAGLMAWGASLILNIVLSAIITVISSLFLFAPAVQNAVSLILQIATFLLVPAIYALALQAVFLDRFEFAFKFQQVWRAITSDWGAYLKLVLCYFVIALVVAAISVLLGLAVLMPLMVNGVIDMDALEQFAVTVVESSTDLAYSYNYSVDVNDLLGDMDYDTINAAMTAMGQIVAISFAIGAVASLITTFLQLVFVSAVTDWMRTHMNPSSPLQRPFFTVGPNNGQQGGPQGGAW